MQNFFFTLAGYRNYAQRYNKYFFQTLSFLKESEWWSEDDIQLYQEKKIRELVEHAYVNSPFIKSQLDGANLRPADIRTIQDLKKIPVCSKNDLRDSGHLYWNQRIPKEKIIKGFTSGTSGRALEVFHTKKTLAFQWAVWARHKERFGVRLGDKHLSFGARVPIDANQTRPPFWRWNHASRQMYLSTFHLSNEYLPAIVDFLNKEPFDYYLGYPSSMYVVASYMEEHNIHLKMRPKYIITGSDALLPHFEKVIRKNFGAPVTEQYGMAEACGNFSKCECGKFHLDFEFGIVELLDIEGEESSNFKRIVFTSLANDTMPLIRYDTGDYGEIDQEPCPCGRVSLTLKSIQGRLEDYIVTPDGRKVSGMNQVFEWASGVKEIQVFQNTPEKIEVRYIPASSFSTKDLEVLEKEFRLRLGNKIQIDFVNVSKIERTTSGKYKAVISNVK